MTKKIWSKNRDSLLLFLLFIAAGSILLLYQEKGDFILHLLEMRSHPLDLFFFGVTELGSGWIFLTAVIIGLLINVRFSLFVCMLAVFTGVIILVLKQSFGFPRPVIYFEWLSVEAYAPFNKESLELEFNSFPSGHMTAATTLYFFLLFLTPSKWIKIGLVLLTVIVGLSRIYLGYHFLQDVLVGGILGAAIGLLFYRLWTSRWIGLHFLHRPLPLILSLVSRRNKRTGK